MITQPFNFAAHLRRPSTRLEVVAFVDVAMLLLFFAVLGSRFVLAPGITLDLPTTPGPPPDAVMATRVLTVAENDGVEMLIFEGRIHSIGTFKSVLEARGDEMRGEVLLVRADRDVSTKTLVQVCDLAVKAGFVRVQLAAEQERPARAGFR